MRDDGNHKKWEERVLVRKHLGPGAAYTKRARIPVHTILERLAEGKTAEEILATFPKLTPADISAAVAYAAEVLRSQGGYDQKTVLGAFFTGIKDPTERIAENGRGAFKLHRLYLETVFHYYRSYLPEPLRRYYRVENFWFPGDALWGVFLKHEELIEEASIARWMWHYLFSAACGLGLAEDYRRSIPKDEQPKLRELKVRGVLLAGEVNDPRFDDDIKIFGGTALSACDRLGKAVLSNSLLLGYVFHRRPGTDETKMFKEAVGSPRLRVADLRTYIQELVRRGPDSAIPGCRIELEALDDQDGQLLRFRSFSRVLKGVENCRLLATKIQLVPTEHPGLDIASGSGGARWERKYVLLKPDRDSYDLHQILHEAGDSAFSFMREVYGSGHILFNRLQQESGRPIVECTKPRFRPRLEDGSVTGFVDLRKHLCCVLPTNEHRSSGGKGVLVQSLASATGTILRFCKVDVKRDLGSRWTDFLDSGCPALELEIKPTRRQIKASEEPERYHRSDARRTR